jgi:isocitrate lyase
VERVDGNGTQAAGRWRGIERPYSAEEVARLRGSVLVEHTLARLGAERLWRLLDAEDYVAALGALTGGQAVQMAKAGLKAIYLSGWQVAADANLAGQTYPDQSLYPSNSAPALVRRLNNALLRADRIDHAEGNGSADYLLPIVADAEAGFGGPLNAFEVMTQMIEAGAARPDEPVHPDARRRAARRRRRRRSDAARRAHGRAQRNARDERRRRARRRPPHR